jgi:hypothetical protein
MWKREPEIERFILLVLVLFMTLLGTLASYAYQVLSGQKFRWQILLLQVFVSVFAGSLVLMAALYYEWKPELAGGISGLAGWSGAGFIKSLEKSLFRRMEEPNDR